VDGAVVPEGTSLVSLAKTRAGTQFSPVPSFPGKSLMPTSTTPPRAPRPRLLVDLSPLRASPAFARLWIGSVISGIGAQMTVVAVGLQIYEMTRSTLAVSLVGGIALIPMIVAGLWGGMIADAFDRRRVLISSSVIAWASIFGLIALSAAEASAMANGAASVPLWPIYVLTTISTMAATISQATRSSVIPRILPADQVSRAAALNGIANGLQYTLGPALAAALVVTIGLPLTFAVDAALLTVGFLGILTLPRLGPLTATTRPGLESLREGMRYLRSAPVVRVSFVVDIIAMTFGRPVVLFPALGATVIGGGVVTVAILTAAAAVGAFLTSLFSGPVQRVHQHGLAVTRAIAVFGLFTMLFGALIAATALGWFGAGGAGGTGGAGGAGGSSGDSGDGSAGGGVFGGVFGAGGVDEGVLAAGLENAIPVALVLATLLMVGAGASDEVSSIFRSAILLTATPDDMRGRLQGVFTVVVTGGPRIGDLYAGILTTLVALWFPPLFGGLVIIVWVTTLVRMRPAFRNYDARVPVN
jgi:MFS family permease